MVDVDGQEVFEMTEDRRSRVLGKILAMQAEESVEVKAFRQDVLEGDLLTFNNAVHWIEQQSTSGKTSIHDNLSYVGEDGGTRSIRIPPNGIISRLKKTATRLAFQLPCWEEAWAVMFILTGEQPPIPQARAFVQECWPFRALDRIVLILDPRLSPREVAEMYSPVRKEFTRGYFQRDKPISDKHLEIAVFAAKKRNSNNRDAVTWERLRDEWNDEHKEWAYEGDVRAVRFSRDARNAWERVTGEEWLE